MDEEDFQLFLALLDGDRFETRFRDGVHPVDVSDLMRRIVEESVLKFDERPLFPERIAYTVQHMIDAAEAVAGTSSTDGSYRHGNKRLADASPLDAIRFDDSEARVGIANDFLELLHRYPVRRQMRLVIIS